MSKEAGNSRTVRVFLSSTFRDFMEERDLLVRKVFPELRRRCRQRQVELIEVDLRWGITEQEAQQGKVLPICLAEIDRARPFFMGLLGERYGWVPEKNQYDLSLIVEQPWLEEHRGGKSVTELEILHGVLNNPAMKNRAFFYLRDPRWAEKKGGAYLGEGPKEKAKLIELKTQIRQSGFPVVENYPNPETLAERVQQDLWKLIDEAYPESEVPDALALERRRHEAYAAARMGLYLGGEKYFEVLDRAMRVEPFIPVLVTGQSGGGKSALLANWVERYRQAHPETGVIVHHLGSGADAADPVKMVVRLMQEIARITGDELKLESDPEKQLQQLPIRLATAGAWAERTKGELLLVLDGLDKVSDRKNLLWFPSVFPAGIKMVASCLTGEILKAAKEKLEWQTLIVEPFSNEEQAAFIREYLGRYRKALTPEQTTALQCFPLSGNPLFLLTVLEELRVFGVHEELEERLKTLLSPPPSKNLGENPTVDDVFEHVLARLEKDLGQKPVQMALEAIWGSRSGLYNEELLALAQLAPVQWAEIYNALDESLYESSGKISFGHDYLRKAVEDRYRLVGKRKLALHRRIASWFEELPADARVADELPWQWRQSERKADLTRCLLRREMFEHAYQKDEYELLSYWLWTGRDIEKSYLSLWESCEKSLEGKELAQLASKIAGFLNSSGFLGSLTESLYLYVMSYKKKVLGKDEPKTLSIFNNLGSFYREKALFKKAEDFYRQALVGYETVKGKEHPYVFMLLNNIGLLLENTGSYEDAGSFYQRAFEGYKKVYGVEHLETLSVLNNIANLKSTKGDFKEAELDHRQILAAREKILGKQHPDTLASLSNLVREISNQGRYHEAEPICFQVYEGFARTLGPEHPNTLKAINNLGNHFSDTRDFEKADFYYRQALSGNERVFGKHHPETLLVIDNLGILMRAKGDIKSAKAFFQKALNGYKKILGADHPETLMCLNNMGVILSDEGDFEGSEAIYRRVLKGKEKALGPQHPDTLGTLQNLALVLDKTGKLEPAAKAFKSVFDGWLKVYGRSHKMTLRVLGHLTRVLAKKEDFLKASHLLASLCDSFTGEFTYLLYNLACYQAISGQQNLAKNSIRQYLISHPEKKAKAISDKDLVRIRAFIEELKL